MFYKLFCWFRKYIIGLPGICENKDGRWDEHHWSSWTVTPATHTNYFTGHTQDTTVLTRKCLRCNDMESKDF